MAGVTEESKLKDLYDRGGLDAVTQEIQSDLNKSKSTTLHIAVTGESGTGKSTFINALRGLGDDDEGAAPTGETETTMEPKMYQYPNQDKVTVWDLPGIGTPNFQASQYLERVKFDQYDFFIILSATRFKENDLHLAQEIQQRKKKFYFVRSKIDHDLASSKRREKSQYNEYKTLEKLRNACVESLRKEGLESPQVFLISGWNLDKFDFEKLQEVLEGDLPALKRRAFLLALPSITASIVEKKKTVMLDEIWKIALLSAAAAAVPIPGFSIACDISLLVGKLLSYHRYFGLDDDSIERLAKRVEKTTEELRSVIKTVFGAEVSASIVVKVLTKIAGAAMMASTVLSWLPLIGTVAAAGISYTTTYSMLKSAVEDMAEDSKRVLVKAFAVD
ncbi:interferon-inducible GTPase 5-like [Heterodontus francisci]|uniref:interferon-inducible GTPase 5-like n=1 Tax=Heterodontus francisci TaxID=7792 RepID=UPI00355B8F81